MKLILVVGTRPNFIKITQFPKHLKRIKGIDYKIVHTGQHYDTNMSTVFFDQFGFSPDIFLGIERGSPATQMASIIKELEKVFLDERPDWVLVVGDVNSTAAAAITANKMDIRLGHIESGLRSFDRTMPEEFNRIITDDLSDIYFVTEQSGKDNLLKEGKRSESIHFVGNTMIDSMVAYEKGILGSGIMNELKLVKKDYVLMTMHRPSTVDSVEGLKKLLEIIDFVTRQLKIVFPIHPRTIGKLKEFGLYEILKGNDKVILTEPLDYFAFQNLIHGSRFVLTDSGGIQEETTYLQIPCLTLRSNTERPSTIEIGSNELLPFDTSVVKDKIQSILNGTFKKGKIPPLWDGHATERIVEVLKGLK